MYPLRFRHAPAALTLVLLFLSGPVEAAKLPDVVVTGDPVAPSPDLPGTGICVASSVSTDPASDFPQSASSFIGGMNDFMERTAANRSTYVLRTPFDLSNSNTAGTQASRGDFVNEVAGCPSYGCGFSINDSSTSFGSRFRGYLNVTADRVNKPLHFGFLTDDAVSFVIFDRNNVQYQVINRPPQLGLPTWRTTNAVTFQRPGLYPVEVLYAEVADHSALEMAVLDGSFTDFERGASQTPIVSLKDSGFLLVSNEKLFQTETGRPSFSNLDQCTQCNRANANAPGNGGCGLNSGLYCNSAALCAPCDTARACGSSCSPCGASAPSCINVNGTYTCVECSSDSQCSNGRCDLVTHTCRDCSDNTDCPSGKVCDPSTLTCVECTADNQCPNGRCDTAAHICRDCLASTDCPSGKVCDPSTFSCVECTADSQCPNGRCDSATHTCRGCNDNTDCSTGRVCNLPTFTCVECNANGQCSNGKTCNLPTFTCVECNSDSQCPNGRICNLPTFACVECRTDSQCPNGKTCNLSTLTCVGCTRDEDCSSSQVCVPELKECRECTSVAGCKPDEPTPEPPGEGCGCGASSTDGGAFFIMLLAGLLISRSLRLHAHRRSSVSSPEGPEVQRA